MTPDRPDPGPSGGIARLRVSNKGGLIAFFPSRFFKYYSRFQIVSAPNPDFVSTIF
jgi:hypothetical protein